MCPSKLRYVKRAMPIAYELTELASLAVFLACVFVVAVAVGG